MGRLGIAILLVVVLMAANTVVGCGPAEGTAEWYYEQGYKFYDDGHYNEGNRSVR